MKFLENRIPPPIVLLGFGAGMWVAHNAFRSGDVWSSPPLGALVSAVGFLVAGLGLLEFRRVKTTINPVDIEQASSLVTTGVYRYTRNPMYLGFTLNLVGLALSLGSLPSVLGPLLFALYVNHLQIRPEERMMESKFGATYLEYKGKVRRW